MPETVNSDLTRTEPGPGPRAEIDPRGQLEPCNVEITLPTWRGGGLMKMATPSWTAPAIIMAAAVLLLTTSVAVMAGVGKLAGLKGWPLFAAAVATTILFGVLAYHAVMRVVDRRAQSRC